MNTVSARNFGSLVVDVHPIAAGTLLSTPFTLVDGTVITLLASTTDDGMIKLSDWGKTAEYCEQYGRNWEVVLERLSAAAFLRGRVTLQDRELFVEVRPEHAQRCMGAMIQAILTLTSCLVQPRESAEAAFARTVEGLVRQLIEPKHDVTKDWFDPNLDPNKAFTVDYRVNGAVPAAHLYVVGSSSKISRITATSLFYGSKGGKVPSLIIVNPDLRIGKKQRERLQVAGERLLWDVEKEPDAMARFVERR